MSTVTSTTPLWIAARQLLDAHTREFFKYWSKVVKKLEAEDIHDLRVASRRLREALALFEPCFPGKGLTRLSRQVKQVTGLLGDLRNTDEAKLFFSQLEPEERRTCDPEIRKLLGHLELEAAAARRQLEDDLECLKPGPLKSALHAEIDRPRLFGNERTDPFQGMSRFADAAIQARALPIFELLPQALDEANAAGQHRLRIAVKKLRYRLEILEPLFTRGFDQLHRDLKGYQEVLGKLHDLDVFAGLVLERVAEGSGQQSLLRVITARRSRLYSSFTGLLKSHPLDALGAQARSYL
jgi:CHAD domain-containing protein